MRIAITGARGYVGGVLAAAAREQGHEVIVLGRGAGALGVGRDYDLRAPVAASTLDDVELVVHAAYDLSLVAADEIDEVNVQGTARLVAASAQAGARVCLISSMSAYPGTEQVYGRAKLACERAVLDSGGCAVRLGLVHGGGDGGMMDALRRIARLPVIPIFAPNSHQFLIHASDVAAAILALAEASQWPTEPIGLAHPVPVRFADLVATLAREQGQAPPLLPVPWRAIYAAMRATERIGIRLPIRADSVLGLVRPAPTVPGYEYWQRVGVSIAPFDGRRG